MINCDKNKTECLVIRPTNYKQYGDSNELQNLRISEKTVNFAKSTRVLGIDIDDNLNFNSHSTRIMQSCWFSWYKITRNSNRYCGLNISSLVTLFKTVIMPKLLYCAPIWLNENNQKTFKQFYAKVCLRISGSTHYSPQGITMLAIGMEPLKITYNIICTKFILKALSSDANMSGLIYQIEESRCHPFYHHILMAKDYLSSKCEELQKILHTRHYKHNSSTLIQIEPSNFFYSKHDINMQKVKLWRKFFASEADKRSMSILNLDPENPQLISIEQHKILFPRFSRRLTDTRIMSLIHGHDLAFMSFKYSAKLASSPFCQTCKHIKDDNMHQLLHCSRYNCCYRESLLIHSDPTSVASLVFTSYNKDQLSCFRKMSQIIMA